MHETLRGDANQMAARKARKTTLCSGICSMQLGPSFLQDADPHLIVSATCESGPSIRCAGKVIINDYGSFISVNVELDEINTG